MNMLRLRFDAVAQEKLPYQLSSLVEKIREHPGFATTGKQQMPQASEQQQAEPMQQRSFVICPICLGTGERAKPNAARAGLCSRCRGRGFLDTSSKSTDL
jgi:hypothetical protein